MKKRLIKFEISFSDKWLYFVIFLGVFLISGVLVFAYNSGKSPSVFGHSGEELTGVCKTNGEGCPNFEKGISSCNVVSGNKPSGKSYINICCGAGEIAVSANNPENSFIAYFSNSGGSTLTSGTPSCVNFTSLDETSRTLQVVCCK